MEPKLKKHLFRLLDALRSSPLTQANAAAFVGDCTGIKPRLLLAEAKATAKVEHASVEVDLAQIAAHFAYEAPGYYLKSDDGKSWGARCRVDAMLELEKIHGLSRRAGRDGGVSPAENALNVIQHTRAIDVSVELGGLAAGLHVLNGNRVLVPRERRPLAAVAGDAGPFVGFVQNLLGKNIDPHWERQYAQFLGWLKWWRESLSGAGLHRPRQFMAFVGPSGCGKSKVQTDITKLMGGAQADPGLWLLGETSFNSGLWAADHLVLSDATLNNRPGIRKALRDKIKELISNPLYPYHPKRGTLRTLPHGWGVSLSANDDEASASIIPEIDDSAAARFSYLRTYNPPVPFPASGTPEGDAFWGAIDASLPAFAHLVDSYVIPAEIAEPRWGVVAWRHPEIIELIQQANPDAELGALLDTWLQNRSEAVVRRTAFDLYAELDLVHQWAFRKLCPTVPHLGQALGRLSSVTGWVGRIDGSGKTNVGENRQQTKLWALTKAPHQ